MKLTRRNRRIIALCLGAVIIILGLLQGTHVTRFDDQTINNVTLVMLFLGIFLVYSGRNSTSGDESKSAPADAGSQVPDETRALDEGRNEDADQSDDTEPADPNGEAGSDNNKG